MENLHTKIYSFEYVLDKLIEKTWSPTEFEEQFECSIRGIKSLKEELIRIGDYCYEGLQNQDNILLYFTQYEWVDRAKSLLILWRDILFEQHKAQILHLDKKADKAALSNLNWESKTTIRKAADELKELWQKKSKTLIKLEEKANNEQFKKWKLQLNPWPVYKEQIAQLPKQSSRLAEQYQSLKTTTQNIQDIRFLILDLLVHCKSDMHLANKNAEETHQFILEHIEGKPGKIAIHLEQLEREIKKPDRLKVLSLELDKKIEQLVEREQVPVATSNGLILYKDIDFKRSVRQWLDSEILPILYEFGELSDNIHNALKMSLINIRNRAILLNNEIKEGRQANWNKEDLCQPLISFLKKTELWDAEINDLEKTVNQRLNDAFYTTAIYLPQEEFLAIPLQSTLNQFKNNPNQLLTRVQQWTDKQLGYVRKFKSTVEKEDSLSPSEKTVRFIEHRTIDIENSQYSSIFLTKGFIGESFWVGRGKELERVNKLIEQWQKSYRGAVLLHGQRLSGKSLFGDYVCSHQFPNKTIKLLPNTSIEIDGRRLNTSYDLGEALDFVKKYSLNNRPVVWIDDLELWRDDHIPLSQNVRVLTKYIDNFSNRIFFIVAMSNWVKTQLNKTNQISKVFQAEINLDRMPLEEIRQAILIRHGATHKVLVDKEGKEESPQQFKKKTAQVYKNANGNIGEALLQWVFSIQKVDEEKVIYDNQQYYNLPEIVNKDAALLLSTIMMEKRTNDRHLRKLFGPAFKEKYRSNLQRLINIGLIDRHIDGWLEINEVAANELGRLLEQKQYLKFYS